ncbi:sphingomyelin phosphodiesterase [Caerostris extrusa]|uniref:Sphingomyelin phosphodiesterase n=1 Tax=Caerostris extrusa TaxID=172846 RepID=A0AAV4MH47_CAEEX|nr:sphingomyelin phosphodiesterase [Caerostris extrusa]
MGNECARITSPLHNWTVPLTAFPKPLYRKYWSLKDLQCCACCTSQTLTWTPTAWKAPTPTARSSCAAAQRTATPHPSQAAGKWGTTGTHDTPPPHPGEHAAPHHLQTQNRLRDLDGRHSPSRRLEYHEGRAGEAPPPLVSKILAKHLPGTPVYPALGNHESARINSFPQPEVTGKFSIQWLHEEVTKAWGRWLPVDAQRTLRE